MAHKEEIQVVVLLGGLGRRLRNREPNLPKAMADIYGKPFFYYQLQLMKWQGLKDFIFCIGYRGKIIKDFFGNGHRFGVSIKYSDDGKELLGTAGALRKALPLLHKDFMLIYGDSYMDVDYREIIYRYYKIKNEGKKKGLMAVFRNKGLYDKSNVIFKNNRLLRYDKKNNSGRMEYIDYGICVLNRDMVGEIPASGYADLPDLYRNFVSRGLIAGYAVRNRFYQIGTPPSLDEFKRFIYQRSFLKKPVLFLDRDGTLNQMCFNKEIGQFDSPLKVEDLRLLPKVASALRIIKSLGYILVVVTNQPAAAKGKTTLERIYAVNNRLKDLLLEKKIPLDDALICPHHPLGSPAIKEYFLIKKCSCRKPKNGLLKIAMKKFNIDASRSYMAGDSYSDVMAAKSVKIKSVFLGNFKCASYKAPAASKPDYVFDNLYDFACYLKKRGSFANG